MGLRGYTTNCNTIPLAAPYMVFAVDSALNVGRADKCGCYTAWVNTANFCCVVSNTTCNSFLKFVMLDIPLAIA